MTQQELTLEQCEELFAKEIVRVDLIPMEGSQMVVPFSVPFVAEMKGSYPNQNPLPQGASQFAQAVLTVSRRPTDDPDALMADGTKMTPQASRETAGVVKKFSLQLPCERGFQAVRAKEWALQNSGDLLIVATAYDGSQYLVYTLPNTTQVAIDDQVTTAGTFAVKVDVQSYSGLIRLTA